MAMVELKVFDGGANLSGFIVSLLASAGSETIRVWTGAVAHGRHHD